MKANIIATSCIALLFGVASGANAQLRAGSPEEAAYMKIEKEQNGDAKLALMLDFEKQFPTTNPKILADVFLRMMDLYATKDDKAKIAEYGDKAIQKDPENISALLRVSRNFILEKTNKEKAREHALKARDIIAKLRAGPAPLNQTEAQWKSWLDQNDTAARQYFEAAQ
jgi:hypothetical protein